MTRGDFKDSILWEAKIQNDTEALAALDALISEELILIGQAHPELLITDAADIFTLESDNPTQYVQALGVDQVQLILDNHEPVTLPEQNQIVGPAILPLYPKCYIVEGNAFLSDTDPKGIRVRLIPEYIDDAEASFSVTFKKVPTLTDDTHEIPAAWIPFLTKEVLKRIAIRRAKGELEVAKMFMQDATQALQVEVSSNAESMAETN